MRRSFAFWQLFFGLGLGAAGCGSGDNSQATSGTFDGSCTTMYGPVTFCWEDYGRGRTSMEQECAQQPTATTNICVASESTCKTMAGTVATCVDPVTCDDPTPVCCSTVDPLAPPQTSATYSTGHCSTRGLSGNCTLRSGRVQFYSGGNPAVAQDSCTNAGGAWTLPN